MLTKETQKPKVDKLRLEKVAKALKQNILRRKAAVKKIDATKEDLQC